MWASELGILERSPLVRGSTGSRSSLAAPAFTAPAKQERIANLDFERSRVKALNLVGSSWQSPSGSEELTLSSPWTGQVIGSVGMSGPADVAAIVDAAREPAARWA